MEQWVCVACWTAAAKPVELTLGSVKLAQGTTEVSIGNWPVGRCARCTGAVVSVRECRAVFTFTSALPRRPGAMFDFSKLAEALKLGFSASEQAVPAPHAASRDAPN